MGGGAGSDRTGEGGIGRGKGVWRRERRGSRKGEGRQREQASALVGGRRSAEMKEQVRERGR
eukprot:3868955-Pleurochrysis_carterae.AAC.1